MSDERLLNLAIRGYAGRDPSHDINHGVQVMANAFIISRGMPRSMQRPIKYAALLHDIADYKYTPTVSPAELREFLYRELPPEEAEAAHFAIYNSSWSKRLNIEMPIEGTLRHTVFHVVRDADWIEAIPFDRCADYARYQRPGEDPLVHALKVCEDKLLKIYDNLYYDESKILAAPLHVELKARYDLEMSRLN